MFAFLLYPSIVAFVSFVSFASARDLYFSLFLPRVQLPCLSRSLVFLAAPCGGSLLAASLIPERPELTHCPHPAHGPNLCTHKHFFFFFLRPNEQSFSLSLFQNENKGPTRAAATRKGSFCIPIRPATDFEAPAVSSFSLATYLSHVSSQRSNSFFFSCIFVFILSRTPSFSHRHPFSHLL